MIKKEFRLLLTGLLLVSSLISAATGTEPENTLVIKVKPVFGSKELVLEKEKYVTAAGDTVFIDRFRFYVSALTLTFEDGTVYREKNSYHLVDAEEAARMTITLTNVPKGKISSLDFSVGIDSLESVSGALDGDLDPVYGMYWAWNSGYINAKLEGRSKSSTAVHNEFEFHIGGYLSPNKTLRKVHLSCNAEGNNNGNILLLADTESWFRNLKLSETSSIVIPGKEAVKMADSYMYMFKIGQP